MNQIKYTEAVVSFSEVPDEISLCINISNCPFKCPGCHSPYLQEDVGMLLTEAKLSELIATSPGITCVCFMGGDRSPKRINHLLQFVKEEYDLKTAWYSGADKLSRYVSFANLNYFKLGPFREDLGGLDKYPLTNQRMYQIDPAPVDNPFGAVFIQTDITKKFVHNNEDISKDTKF